MSEAITQAAAYDLIDRFLRNNLYDDDYAKYSEALEALSQPAPSPQPAVPVVSDAGMNEAASVLGNELARKHAVYLTLGSVREMLTRALLALRPAAEPMTDERREVLAALVVGACEHKTRTLLALRAIEATEDQYGIGITAKAEDAHQPTKEAEKP